MIPTKTIQLDFWRHPTDILHLVQGEADGRKVEFKITDNGSAADLTGFIAIFAIRKPDGNVVVNSATITEAELGIVETTISSQVVTTAGNAHAELHLMKEGQLSKSFRIVTKVAPGVDVDGIAPSVSEFNALQTLIGQAGTVISIADTELWPEVVENAQYFSDLAGAGRTVETVKGNADAIALKANKAQEAWITPTLLDGGITNPNDPVMFRKNQFGVVEFKGRATSGTGASIFTLPLGYRTGTNRSRKFPIITGAYVGSGAVTPITIQSGNIYTGPGIECDFSALKFVAEG